MKQTISKLRCANIALELAIAIGSAIELEYAIIQDAAPAKYALWGVLGLPFFYFAVHDAMKLVAAIVENAIERSEFHPNPYDVMYIVQTHQFITDRLKKTDMLPKDYKGAMDYIKEHSEKAATESTDAK